MTDAGTDADVTAIREIQPSDRDAWTVLFRGYRDFYALEPDDGVIDVVWSWLVDPGHELQGLIALRGGIPVGIAHWRRFARPSRGGTAIFLDDLFVAADLRGGGIGRSLIARLQDVARDEGLLEVRWITSETNRDAQRLYDRIAQRSPFLTYVTPPA